MEEKDIAQIKVGQFTVGISGIGRLMEEMAGNYADKSEDEICSFMLAGLEGKNYIPAGARSDYGRAFLREFQKFLGRPCQEDACEGLDIKVLGVGCGQCEALAQRVMDVLSEINLPAGVDRVTDIKEIARYGLMGSPALLINGKAVAVGSVPPRQRVRKWLMEAREPLRQER